MNHRLVTYRVVERMVGVGRFHLARADSVSEVRYSLIVSKQFTRIDHDGESVWVAISERPTPRAVQRSRTGGGDRRPADDA